MEAAELNENVNYPRLEDVLIFLRKTSEDDYQT
jgi:hypothetical protein